MKLDSWTDSRPSLPGDLHQAMGYGGHGMQMLVHTGQRIATSGQSRRQTFVQERGTVTSRPLQISVGPVGVELRDRRSVGLSHPLNLALSLPLFNHRLHQE